MLKLFLPAILSIAGLPGLASAQETSPDIRVAYRDLDLRQPGDIRRLDRRINIAIRASCPPDDNAEVERRLEVVQCRAAKRRAVADQRSRVLARAAAERGMAASAP